MVDGYELRPANAEDADAIIRWFPTHESAIIWGGHVPDPPTAEWLAGEFLDVHRRYYVLADKSGSICGTYFLYHMPDECRTHLGRFAIAPNLRRRGLATLMIKHAVDAAQSQSARTLTLKVLDRNLIARSVYDRAGFIATGETTFDERLGGNILSMMLRL